MTEPTYQPTSIPDYLPVNPRKTTTAIQKDSVYKEEFILPGIPPSGVSASIEFKNPNSQTATATVSGTISGNTVTFQNNYSQVSGVTNGAIFYCYVTVSGIKHLIAYGTTFLRQLTFPSVSAYGVVFEDDFQRPEGEVGNNWVALVGKPKIFDNTALFGYDRPNTVGPKHDFFSRYFMRFYHPFDDDKINLRVGLSDKGEGHTFIALCGTADMSSYIYAHFHTKILQNKITLGIGTGPDIGDDAEPINLNPMSDEVDATISKNGYPTIFRIKYNESSRKLSVTNDASSYEFVSWTDGQGIAPHGLGYRYFGIGGRASLLNSGIQVSGIAASTSGV